MKISIQESPSNKKRENLEAQAFLNKYPFAPSPTYIDRYDVIIKDKEEAIRIAQGMQTELLLRNRPFIAKDLYSDRVFKWIKEQKQKGENPADLFYYFDHLNIVNTIHLHDWKDSWYVDIDVLAYRPCELTPELIDELHQHGIDKKRIKELKQQYKSDEQTREWIKDGVDWVSESYIDEYFVFKLGYVRGTNLIETKPKATLSVVGGHYKSVDDFFNNNLDMPESAEEYAIDLVITKEEAIEYAKGNKTIIVRPTNWLYIDMFLDQDVLNWEYEKTLQGDTFEDFGDFVDSQKFLNIVCFCDLTDEWYLNMSVENDFRFTLNKDDLDLLHEHGCYDYDEYYHQIETEIAEGTREESDRPVFFGIIVDAVLGTDLKI